MRDHRTMGGTGETPRYTVKKDDEQGERRGRGSSAVVLRSLVAAHPRTLLDLRSAVYVRPAPIVAVDFGGTSPSLVGHVRGRVLTRRATALADLVYHRVRGGRRGVALHHVRRAHVAVGKQGVSHGWRHELLVRWQAGLAHVLRCACAWRHALRWGLLHYLARLHIAGLLHPQCVLLCQVLLLLLLLLCHCRVVVGHHGIPLNHGLRGRELLVAIVVR